MWTKKADKQAKSRVSGLIPLLPELGDSALLYKYRDYEEYRSSQIELNVAKLDRVWADEQTLSAVGDRVLELVPEPKGLCHGTRNGFEQRFLANYTGGLVLGTEIADSAESFPSTVRWDFHEENPDWLEAFDFVYSNSLDHSYDPILALNTWFAQVKPGGSLFLEWTEAHGTSFADKGDPFGSSATIIPYLVAKIFGHKASTSVSVSEKKNSFGLWQVLLFDVRKVS
jgi:hypothetical protein